MAADKSFLAMQLNRALQIFAQNLELDDESAMEIADLYPEWTGDSKRYLAGTIVKYGVNKDGETQLYTVIQEHTSQADWTPGTVASLYKAIGFTESGVPIWTQPLGGHDAYALGHKVSHKGQIWESTCNGNVWEPGVYGWSVV